MSLKIRPAWSGKAGNKGGAIISIPLKDRKISGLSVGDTVEIESSPNQIIIRKMEVVDFSTLIKTVEKLLSSTDTKVTRHNLTEDMCNKIHNNIIQSVSVGET